MLSKFNNDPSLLNSTDKLNCLYKLYKLVKDAHQPELETPRYLIHTFLYICIDPSSKQLSPKAFITQFVIVLIIFSALE